MLITMDRLQAEHGVKPRNILHIGAHLGEEAAAYHDAGAKEVLWVEGNPHLMDTLRHGVSAYPGQKAVHALVSDTDGAEAVLHLASFSMSSSILPPKEHLRHYPGITYPEAAGLPMKTTTVDTLLRDLGYGPGWFDFANLDIEGAELHAMRGMRTVLPYLKWLYLEVNFEEMYEGCAMLPDVDAFLSQEGFDRVAYEDAFLEGGRKVGWGDACYRRRDG
jgi:FkbM family methyltransferase